MNPGAVFVATCLASALATVLMGVMANYPIAVAPAMGHNFFFAFTVVLGMHVAWPVALGAVFVAGAFFVLTAGFGLRERLITAIPDSVKHAIAVGIGRLIALVGLEWAGSRHRSRVDPGGDDDDAGRPLDSLGRSHRGDPGVSDDAGHAAGGERHRRDRVRVHSYAVLKLVTGRAHEAHWLVHASAVLFILRYVFLARS